MDILYIILYVLIAIGVGGVVYVVVKKMRNLKKSGQLDNYLKESKESLQTEKVAAKEETNNNQQNPSGNFKESLQKFGKRLGTQALIILGVFKVIGVSLWKWVRQVGQLGKTAYSKTSQSNFWIKEEEKKKRRALSSDDQAGPLVLAGQKLLVRNKFDEAEQRFVKAVELDHKSIDAFTGLGELYFKKRNYQYSIESYRQVIKLSKTPDSKVFVGLAVSLKKFNQPGEAKKVLENGLEYYPDNFRMKVELNDMKK